GLGKTRSGWLSKLSGLFSRGALGEEAYEQLEEILLSSDVGPKTTAALLTRLRERVKAEKITETSALKGILKEELLAILRQSTAKGTLPPEGKPLVVMVTGVNGAGKTTSIGKLAWRFAKEGKGVLLGAADTFRAAAMEQLGIWAERTGAQIVTGRAGADPGAVAFDAIKAGEARNCQIVLIDTAGRLHTKSGLMEELTKVKRVMGKAFAGAPHEVWLVIDANTGQNAIAQAREFNEALGLTGLVVAKLDGTAKGGAIFAIAQELSLPVRYVGVGEKAPDLLPFDPEAFVQALFEEN
ncbi:MAG: signal recognition particle-docking protein FtsY, partial [Bdellovibrionota bacterium]